ncbi:MAG: metallophosphoesterase [Clostridia bacterium]|nr:metallophosphoesterase [Clostridia bacterium]
MEHVMKLNPTVCAVGKNYQIMIVAEQDALISVRVGDKIYYHHSNGIRISAARVHRFCVPAQELDRECAYTVLIQKMIERSAYFPKSEPVLEKNYRFRPVKKTNEICLYHLADVHGELQQAIHAASYFDQPLDLLIMNGDISSTSNTFEDMIACYKIASEVTKGEIPCVISRGNHDLRGQGAESLAGYMPGDEGRSYYTFRVGCIWGILVDTGEDKEDSSPEYGGTVCCHEFRLEQEKMLKKIIQNASDEYAREGVKYRLVVSHVPFTFKRNPPFDIERQLYSNWSALIRENIRPDLMLCGHTHKACVSEPGSEYDDLGQPCTVIVGSDVSKGENGQDVLAGAFIQLSEDCAKVAFNTEHTVLDEKTVFYQK